MPALIATLKSDTADPDVKEACGHALWNIGSAAFESLFDLVRAKSARADARRIAFRSIHQMDAKEKSKLYPIVLEAISDADAGVRREAIWLISSLGINAPATVDVLSKRLKIAKGEEIVWLANALDSTDPDNPLAVRTLMKYIEDEADSTLKSNAIHVLSQWGVRGREAAGLMVRLLSSSEVSVRLAAVGALSGFEDNSERVISALKLVSANDPDKNVRGEASKALKRLAKVRKDR